MGAMYALIGYLVVTVLSGAVVARVTGWTHLPVAVLGVERLSSFVLFLLLLAVGGGWIFHVSNITALGFGERRFAFVAPTLGIAGAIAYAILVRVAPGLRSDDSLLFLVGAGAL